MKKLIGAGLGVGILTAAGWWALAPREAGTDAFLQSLVHIPGTTFEAGNFTVQVRLEDGTIEERLVARPGEALAPYEVTLVGFYLSDREATVAELTSFARATDRPEPELNASDPNLAARVNYAVAEAYCAWLAMETGLPVRLPREAEWELAARSGGATVPFATDDGSYRKGINVADPSAPPPAPASLPPNPYGLFDMVAGTYEWVADTAEGDPADSRIAKGSSDAASSFFDPIPDRYVTEPTTEEALAAVLLVLEHEGLPDLTTPRSAMADTWLRWPESAALSPSPSHRQYPALADHRPNSISWLRTPSDPTIRPETTSVTDIV